MLGLLMGFQVGGPVSLDIMISACVGGAVALFMSGISSAYISESAEKQHELRELEKSMITSLDDSAHAEAARLMPWLIALVNGASPLILSLLIISPLFLAKHQLITTPAPLNLSLAVAAVLAFLMGVYLGRLSGRFWLWSGIHALLVALSIAGIILLLQ